MREYGPCWRQLTLVACVFNYFHTGGTEEQIDMAKLDEFMARVQEFDQHIEAIGLLNVHEMNEPLINLFEL